MSYIADDVALSPLAARMAAELARAQGPYPEPELRDASRLTDEELGALLPAAYAAANLSMRWIVEGAAGERQPRFTPGACLKMFDALVDGLPRRRWADLDEGVGALLRCTGPWPDGLAERAATLVRAMLELGRELGTHRLLAVARLAGPETYAEVAAGFAADGEIARAELDLLLPWEVRELAAFSEVGAYRRHRSVAMPVPPEAWDRVADAGYAEFARRALAAAEARVAAVQAGEVPYRADKAFTSDEVETLGRAARTALRRDEPWLPDLLDRLLRGVVVAPEQNARTLPSQALLFEITRAVEAFPTPEAVASLRAVRRTVRHKGVPKQLDRMLKRVDAALAERTEVALRMPDLGFAADGTLRTPVGDCTAVVTVGEEDAVLGWHGPDGRPRRSVPAPVRREHGDTVKELRNLVKQVRAHLTTLVRALEGGFPVEAAQPYGRWRDGLVRHPLAGTTVRRLIWEIEVEPGLWRAVLPSDDGLLDSSGAVVAEPDEDAAVRLWHPIRSGAGEIARWRDLIVERGVRQPFKQAFREVYRLTPAEEEAGTHSERFAAHLVHYRRMFALLRARGWKSDLLGPWDGGSEDEAERVLAGEWRAAFRHIHVDEDVASTDRVRFARRTDAGWRNVPLAEVPPLVFSEAMRDVDLFVGVTSLAADPDWARRREDPYWEYRLGNAFGELTPSAEARREALARILPRTRIADRCELTDRFLVVRGDLRTYRIHLGSANILMDPDGAYLCVVPARSGPAVHLPFQEDRLSLILSKAFLLAADTGITDESIRGQIALGLPVA
ncbi:DUF4132 domain-containing protein [Thermomonospora cellulosilytica]|uniref:DUF4132 domain-containing protein n=1 Tax=Thermomonospora cellulosilytica TaxID=1411118 RepID=A0A7W3MVY3_9ACTN|nr:DUF4132 domain-containing protein [Thermomonospora cellulosilytica]MBA9002915.1 hypothetical protein [Thermomonospora cellulosilytica]